MNLLVSEAVRMFEIDAGKAIRSENRSAVADLLATCSRRLSRGPREGAQVAVARAMELPLVYADPRISFRWL